MGGFTVAIGLILAVVVGIFVSWALGEIDKHYSITDQVITGLDELRKNTTDYIENQKREIMNAANDIVEPVIDYSIASAQRIIVNLAIEYFRKLTSPSPRLQ